MSTEDKPRFKKLEPGVKTLVPTTSDREQRKRNAARMWQKLTGKQYIDPDTGLPIEPD